MQSEPQPAPAGTRPPDVRDMAIVHQAYRREFALAPRILRDLLPEESERRAAAAEQCSAPDAEFMLSHLPPDVRAAWDSRGAQQYTEWMTLLRHGIRPVPPATARAQPGQVT